MSDHLANCIIHRIENRLWNGIHIPFSIDFTYEEEGVDKRFVGYVNGFNNPTGSFSVVPMKLNMQRKGGNRRPHEHVLEGRPLVWTISKHDPKDRRSRRLNINQYGCF